MISTAIFTDVAPEDAVDGLGGFNFQAVSAGFSGVEQRVARDAMIHVVTHDGDETEPSFAYRYVDGRCFFSRGHGLGRTLSGRGGNQITEIAVASSAADLAPYAPAQVFACTRWKVERRPGKTSDEWVPPLSLGAPGGAEGFEAAALLEWARQDSARWSFLPAALSALEDKLRDRTVGPLVLVHDELETLVRWYALLSILSDQAAVRQASFRAFEATPARASTDVVGCRPAVLGTGGGGLSRLDLTTLEAPAVRPSFAVARTMELLEANGEEGLLEGFETVALARSWSAAMTDEQAFWAAELVTGTEPGGHARPDRSFVAGVLDGLATHGFVEDLQTYDEEFSTALRYSMPGSTDDVAALTRTAVRHAAVGSHVLAGILLDAVIHEVCDHLEMIPSWIREMRDAPASDPWPQDRPPSEWARDLTTVAQRTDPRDLGPVCWLAGPLQTHLDPAEWSTVTTRFADEVFRHPEHVDETDGLWNGSDVREQVRMTLVEALGTQSEHADAPLPTDSGCFADLRAGRWDRLVALSAPGDGQSAQALLRWAHTAQSTRGDTKGRAKLLRSLDPPPSPSSWRAYLAGTSYRAESELWKTWLLGPGMDPGLSRSLAASIDRDLRDPLVRAVELEAVRTWLDRLEDQGLHLGADVSRARDELDARLGERPSALQRLGRVFGGRGPRDRGYEDRR